MQTKHKLLVTDIFLTTAIAYELGGSWRNVFRYYANITLGSTKKICNLWLKKTDEEIRDAIEHFYNSK